MITDRLDHLLNLYFDEGLDANTQAELERYLLAWPQAREHFWKRADINRLLRQIGQESWGQNQGYSASTIPTDAIVQSKLPLWIAVSACVLVSSLLILMGFSAVQRSWNFSGDQANKESNAEMATASYSHPQEKWVAILRKAIDVQWLDPEKAPSVGEPLTAGRLQFSEGLIEIQTNRGAKLLLEGPADLEIVSDMVVRCQLGRLRVDVPPPAHGFLVDSPLVNVVDRGTSFAMDVSGDQKAEVHVITGMVELHSQTYESQRRELRQGESIRVAPQRGFQEIPPETDSFPTATLTEARTRAASDQMLDSWKRQRDAIASDPRCLLYFDFDDEANQDTVLKNAATVGDKRSLRGKDGTIIGCEWIEGRWPGKRALEFKSISDRVRFSVPGRYKALTCLASVRLDSLDNAFNALLMSGDAIAGEIQWQFSFTESDGGGRMRTARRYRSGWGFTDDHVSEAIFRRERFGTWMQVAIVHDTESGLFRQYLDGKLIATRSYMSNETDEVSFLQTGDLELGNWTPKQGQPIKPIRHFCGRIDEFAIMDRGLSSEEIQELHSLSWRPKNEAAIELP
jgi:hypothetical protein